jgi:hypothetical protein
MTYAEALAYFGSGRGALARLCRALRLSHSSVLQWQGVIPELRQYQLEVLTRGRLRADKYLRWQVSRD